MNGWMRWVVAGVLAVFVQPDAVSAMGIELSAGLLNQDVAGDFWYRKMVPQDELSIKNNLNYDYETNVFGRVKIRTPIVFPDIYIMATPMRFEGVGAKNTSFTFGNVRYDANIPFTSNLKLDHYDLALSYAIPGLRRATLSVLNIDIGVNARLIDFEAEITGNIAGNSQIVTQYKDVRIPMPQVYVGVQVKPVNWLSGEGELRGITYSGHRYIDIIGRAKVKPYGPVFAAAGYRYENVMIDRSDFRIEVDFSGPFGEIGVEF